ncbi:MAG: hypothetical protein LAQ30_32050 [Acidobacteriia bacterium]|nr:hypothetical protein [Terriglobia bacterium]
MRLQPRGEPRISGDTASVECEQAITAVDEQGRHRVTAPPTVTVRLKRGAAGWVIESFQ